MADASCEDWQCPSRWSCQLFFGRSQAYAAVEIPGPPLFRGNRDGEDACNQYKPDKPRKWLMRNHEVTK